MAQIIEILGGPRDGERVKLTSEQETHYIQFGKVPMMDTGRDTLPKLFQPIEHDTYTWRGKVNGAGQKVFEFHH